MAPDTVADHGAQPARWILVVSAVLSALFAYLASVALVGSFQAGGEFGFPTASQFISMPLMIAVGLGAGLRWLARRYRTHTVQAGGIIGAGMITIVVIAVAWAHWQNEIIYAILTVIPFFVAVRITGNPSPESGESTGIALLRQSLPLVGESNGTVSGILRDMRRRPSISRYWLVVGSAFAVCVPIALADTELGIGLLSTFLTAYALSHRIENESSDSDNGS